MLAGLALFDCFSFVVSNNSQTALLVLKGAARQLSLQGAAGFCVVQLGAGAAWAPVAGQQQSITAAFPLTP